MADRLSKSQEYRSTEQWPWKTLTSSIRKMCSRWATKISNASWASYDKTPSSSRRIALSITHCSLVYTIDLSTPALSYQDRRVRKTNNSFKLLMLPAHLQKINLRWIHSTHSKCRVTPTLKTNRGSTSSTMEECWAQTNSTSISWESSTSSQATPWVKSLST